MTEKNQLNRFRSILDIFIFVSLMITLIKTNNTILTIKIGFFLILDILINIWIDLRTIRTK